MIQERFRYSYALRGNTVIDALRCPSAEIEESKSS